ncbi:MAG: aldehyde dehydrogenase family protein [Pirellulales bacterium]|nr:aldehyde dehydrogenase family protein [Pirellulales bacterium]
MATVLKDHLVSDATRRFLDRAGNLWINGEWCAARSEKTFEVYNPATGEIIARCAAGDRADIDAAVHAARYAFESGSWSRMTASERGRLIWKLGDLLEEHGDEFAELETLDNGKPFNVARAADVPLAIDLFRYMAGWATKIHGQTFPISVPYMPGSEFFSYTAREPIGVAGQIIPWNFPLLMAAWKLGPALAAGCTVVLKPAEQTPLSALRLGELIEEAGFPEGVVNIVTGLGETAGAALAAHPDVDKIAFTGSTEVGRLIVEAAGKSNLKKVTLELGGKSPNIVLADADLSAAIPGAAGAIFFNHGQCCCAGSRLYVQKSIYDEVVEGVAHYARQIRVGSGFDAAAQMGPLVSQEQLDRVCGYIEAGIRDGARLVAGGRRKGERGYFVEPTVFAGARQSMKIVREEIFGPVVAAMPFDDPEEVLSLANDSAYGLAAAVWTRDVTQAHRLARRLKAGNVWINCYNIFDAALPFGGYKESGWGREMGLAAVELYTEIKAVTTRLA